jgi:hypothetical protein
MAAGEESIYFRHGANTWKINAEEARARLPVTSHVPIAPDDLNVFRQLRQRLQ